ncbi:MAG: hypothetical protein J7J86_07435 [Bacteroidales bacterium]|nr:hypothetical protein [Bacteroidales bacterium]
MKPLHKILTLIFLIYVPFGLFGQNNAEYENEEIKVINQFLSKLIEADRLSSLNKTDSSLIVYFQTNLICNLEKDPLFKGDYKSNKLLKRLENNYLGERIIDTTKVDRINKIKFLFENKQSCLKNKYDSDIVIGTLNISRISFNKSLTIGYFYYTVYCGEDCGWGDLLRIEKKNGIWEITDYLISWIS